MPRPRWPGRTRMHQIDHTGRSSTCGILRDLAKGRSARGATAAQPTTSPASYASTPGDTGREQRSRTKSARSCPASERLSLASMRWLRHQQTEEVGFFGPTIVATSSNRAAVAGSTSIVMEGTLAPPTDKVSGASGWISGPVRPRATRPGPGAAAPSAAPRRRTRHRRAAPTAARRRTPRPATCPWWRDPSRGS